MVFRKVDKGPGGGIMMRRAAFLDAARAYADGPLRKALRWGRQPIQIEAAQGGSASLLYFASLESGFRLALQVFDDAKAFDTHRRALQLATRHALPAPRLLVHDGGWFSRARYGLRFLAMEAISGSTLAQTGGASPDMLRAFGRALGRFHSVESPRWGAPGRLKRRSYAENLRRGAEERLLALDAAGSDFGRDEIEALRRWMSDQTRLFEGPDSFQLCHHHIAGDDVMFDAASGKAALIDCASLQFSRASRDLAAVRAISCVGAESSWREFLEHYLAASPPSRREEYEREGPFFEAFFVLSKARNLVARSKTGLPLFADDAPGASLRRDLLRLID